MLDRIILKVVKMPEIRSFPPLHCSSKRIRKLWQHKYLGQAMEISYIPRQACKTGANAYSNGLAQTSGDAIVTIS
jgi:hypothetical protein